MRNQIKPFAVATKAPRNWRGAHEGLGQERELGCVAGAPGAAKHKDGDRRGRVAGAGLVLARLTDVERFDGRRSIGKA